MHDKPNCKLSGHDVPAAWLQEWKTDLVSRRSFLVRAAGGVVAAVFPRAGALRAADAAAPDADARWALFTALHSHMLPSEEQAPGARELHCIGYLRFVLDAPGMDSEEKDFILQGAGWLEDMAQQQAGMSFVDLDEAVREAVLRRVEQSRAGSNWLALNLYYLIEGILADPVYGGNRGGAGWRWLHHVPGFPLPPVDKRYPELKRR